MPDDVQSRIITQVQAADTNAKMTAAKAKAAQEKRDDAIREAMQSGVTVTELARALDMNRSRLYQILNASK